MEASRKIKKSIFKRKKGVVALTVILGAIIISLVIAPLAIKYLPHAIKANGETVCYVKNDRIAEDAIYKTYKSYVPKGAKIILCINNANLGYKLANPIKSFNKTVSETDAVDAIKAHVNNNSENSIEIFINYIITKRVEYTPEPEYRKSENLLAGRQNITRKAINGTKDITLICETVNGDVSKEIQVSQVIVNKGTSAIIEKGVLGLPDGADWKTYDGDPVFKKGEDLINTALLYKGAPYKHGGTNLKTGVSCVGFVRAIYLKYGINIGNSHHSMETAGIGVSYESALPGDIICYRGHVGLYMGNGKMIDATSKRGVGVSTVHPKSIIAVRRIIE